MAGEGGGLSRRAQLFDAGLAVLLFAVDIVLWLLLPRSLWPPSWPVAVAWQALAYVALALRRRALPVAVALVSVQVLVASMVPSLSAGARRCSS
jgi:hypothetical protein